MRNGEVDEADLLIVILPHSTFRIQIRSLNLTPDTQKTLYYKLLERLTPISHYRKSTKSYEGFRAVPVVLWIVVLILFNGNHRAWSLEDNVLCRGSHQKLADF